jgi:methyl-accepting chemotaxis protein
LIGVVGYVSLNQLYKIAQPLSKCIPDSINIVATTAHIDSLAQFIRYYDEVLTQSARNYAFTQNKKWKEKYRAVEPKLDKTIKEAVELGDKKDKEFFLSVDEANMVLVGMEYRSIKLVDTGQAAQAVKVLESNEYWDQKKIYEKGLRDYISRRGAKYDEALLSSTEMIHSATEEAQNLIKTSTRLVLVFVVGISILAIGLGIFISGSISAAILKLKDAVVEIGKGNLDTKIAIRSKDEIGDLANSFKKMAHDLKGSRTKLESYSKDLERDVRMRTKEIEAVKNDLERTVDERTKNLQEKLAELEQFRKATVDREFRLEEMRKEVEKLKAEKDSEQHK